jgi:hypothetical protein
MMADRPQPGLAGILVGLVALAALGIGAVTASRSETSQLSARATRDATISNQSYSCLTAEAHALVRPSDVVFLGETNLYRWVMVIKSMGGWADFTTHQSRATVAVLLEHVAHGPSCGGNTLLAIRREPGGKVLMTRARPPRP